MKLIAFLICTFILLQMNAQNHFKAEVGQGLFITDILHDDTKSRDFFGGWGNVTTVNLYYTHDKGDKFYFDYGVGFSNYNFFDFSVTEDNISYFNLRLAVNYRSFIKNTDFTIGVTQHFRVSGQGAEGATPAQKSFTNLDLGFIFHLGKKWNLRVTSPITISPMYKETFTFIGSPPFNGTFDYWVGTTGLNFGLAYKFGRK